MDFGKISSLLALGGIKVSSLTAGEVVDLATKFGLKLDDNLANAVVANLPRFVSNPEGTLSDFLSSGDWLNMLANREPVKPGQGIIRCPHCEELIFTISGEVS